MTFNTSKMMSFVRACTIGAATLSLSLTVACGSENPEDFQIEDLPFAALLNADGNPDETDPDKKDEPCATVACAPGYQAVDEDGDGCYEGCEELRCHVDEECPEGFECRFDNGGGDPLPPPEPQGEEGDEPNSDAAGDADNSEAGEPNQGGVDANAMPGYCREKLPDNCYEVTICTACEGDPVDPDPQDPDGEDKNADDSAAQGSDEDGDALAPEQGETGDVAPPEECGCWTEIHCDEPQVCPAGSHPEVVCEDDNGEPTDPETGAPDEEADDTDADSTQGGEGVVADPAPGVCYEICVPDAQGCDDGSELLCDSLEPDCRDDQVSAVINNCWECVDANTCQPDQGDCVPGDTFVADECGNTCECLEDGTLACTEIACQGEGGGPDQNEEG